MAKTAGGPPRWCNSRRMLLRKSFLRAGGHLLEPKKHAVAMLVAKAVHSGRIIEAANTIAEFSKISLKFREDDDPKKGLPLVQQYLHALLNGGGMAEAAQILWSPTQFTPEPSSVKAVWSLFD